MHPAIAEFPNNAFYYNEHLEPVPLPHQEEDHPYSRTCEVQDNIDRLLTERRMVFIPAETPDNPNLSEKQTRTRHVLLPNYWNVFIGFPTAILVRIKR